MGDDADHAERLARFREQAEAVRQQEVEQIAVDVLGLDPAEVARALRGVLTRDDVEGE